MNEILASREIITNAQQKKRPQDGTPVVVQAKSEEDLPDVLTSLSKKKVQFLIKGITQIRQSDRVLELFGGTNASTATIKAEAKPKEFVSIDLHNSLSSRAPWKYLPKDNYGRQQKQKSGNPPSFIAADAAQLPFADDAFDVIVAPDSPRNGAERISESMAAGRESALTFDEQQILFKESSSEAYRVLVFGGKYVGTAPLSWAQNLASAGFGNVQLFSHAELPGVTKVQISRDLQFKTQDITDPVVYFKCIK